MNLSLKDETNRLKDDREDLIRALSWLHDTAILHHLDCESQTEFGNALDRAWETLESMKGKQ